MKLIEKIYHRLKRKENVEFKLLKNYTQISEFKEEEKNKLYDYWLNNNENNINKWHHYFPIYYKHFSKYINKPVNVLEIGINRGGSLKMWKDFFGTESKIFGVDILPECKKFENINEGIFVEIGDQADPVFLKYLMDKLPKIDIIIDDGGHKTKQQITTFNECYSKIADDGVYLCEDLHTNYWCSFIDTKITFIEFAKKHIDALNAWYYKRYDKNKNKYGVPSMPEFTNITHSITFYNSVIVFEKMPICRPKSEIR